MEKKGFIIVLFFISLFKGEFIYLKIQDEDMKAFVLISLNEGNERKMLEALKQCPEVRQAYVLFGEWDVLAEVDVMSAEELGTMVMERIRSREGVRLTSSLIVAGK